MQLDIKEMISKFIADSKRIFVVSKKPTTDEFKKMAIIIGIGFIAIGLIGFIVELIFALVGIFGA